jgi:hypothetical protein
MKNTRKRGLTILGCAVLLVLTACSGGGSNEGGANGEGAGRGAAAGQAVPPESAGVQAASVDSTPEPVEDPRHAVAALAVAPTVERGKTATLTFRTRPGSSCQVEMRPSGSNGEGGDRLPAAVANDAGLVSWAWNVSSNAAPGPAVAYVVCSGGQRGQAEVRIS